MSITTYHQIKCVRIIYSRIKVVYQNIHLYIDIYIFVSKFINNILFFSLQDAGISDSHPPTAEKDIQEQEEDEKDDEEDLT